jgi:glycosyltransferase involved in cell wall biosynthesis
VFVQGYQIFASEFEAAAYRTPVPKICIAQWLADVVRSLGCPRHQAVHIPYGLRHDKYRMKTELEDRPLQVSMLYNAAPTKSANYGLDALALLKARIPSTRIVVFGGTEPTYEIPDGVTYLTSPTQNVIVDEIYNQSRVFINSSIVEGFGVACIEAMACGAALVTTSNGGSDDYAIHDDTALVSEPTDVATMADHIESLLVDDDARMRLARSGREYVRRFDWNESARVLEQFLERYLADPAAYQQPASSPSDGLR